MKIAQPLHIVGSWINTDSLPGLSFFILFFQSGYVLLLVRHRSLIWAPAGYLGAQDKEYLDQGTKSTLLWTWVVLVRPPGTH